MAGGLEWSWQQEVCSKVPNPSNPWVSLWDCGSRWVRKPLGFLFLWGPGCGRGGGATFLLPAGGEGRGQGGVGLGAGTAARRSPAGRERPHQLCLEPSKPAGPVQRQPPAACVPRGPELSAGGLGTERQRGGAAPCLSTGCGCRSPRAWAAREPAPRTISTWLCSGPRRARKVVGNPAGQGHFLPQEAWHPAGVGTLNAGTEPETS